MKAFLRTSNYTRQQALKSSSSDWAFWKYCCEHKLLQTLVKSLKVCLKEIFLVKLSLYIVQNITLLLFVHLDSQTRMQKTHFYIIFEKLFLQKLVYMQVIFSYNNHVTIRNQKTRIITDVCLVQWDLQVPMIYTTSQEKLL